MTVGIEALNVFAGTACIDVAELARHRGLEPARFENLMMREKTVVWPHEDPVSFAVNAAQPLLETLSVVERGRIELLITCSESGVDFGKSLSTYVHHHLGLPRNCRLFEIKQACYSGTAGLQMAAGFILSRASPGARALVIATDISRFTIAGGSALTQDWSFAEPSSGAGAVAMLVSDRPRILELDVGANGYYGYEVMDTCRPNPDSEAGNADLSLLSYLDCCENAFLEYRKRVRDADYRSSFQQLIFHTPFGGMVKGAHRTMMRKLAAARPAEIEADFTHRVAPGLVYCRRVGNIMGGTVFLALASAIDQGEQEQPIRIGCFSYGSGCCSEFFSGVVPADARRLQERFGIARGLEKRRMLTMKEYEELLRSGAAVKFGTRNIKLERPNPSLACKQLFLSGITDFHREYVWLS
jgi:polyketide biosynthesis 3-hydroxy-3-methylglutaryl-CoA synthase-like enzyme PksG